MATEWSRTIQKKQNGIAGQRTTIQQRHIRDSDSDITGSCSGCRNAPTCYSKRRQIDPSEVLLRG